MNPKLIFSVCRKHLPTILSIAASGGVALTGYLSYKAAKKEEGGWKKLLPPLIAGAGTIACVVGANHIHLGREAALAAAVAFYKASGEDFEDAVFDKFSDAGLKANVMDADKNAEPPKSMNMKLRIWEPYTKQWFEATQQEIIWAELTANKMLQQHGVVKLNDVLRMYNDPKLKMKPIGEKLGWSYDDEMFCEGSSYYYCGGWIDMCPQWEDYRGSTRFVMNYGINPNDISEIG